MGKVIAFHEHELKPGVDAKIYEQKVSEAIKKLQVPGLLEVYHLKGFKGERSGKYAVLWTFESEEAIVKNFGTPDDPKWPKDWLYYENEVLAPFLDRHPDKINFTDHHVLFHISFKVG